jgi:hypothetical protein
MLEAIFGGIFSFAVRIGARLLDAAVAIFRDELGVSSRNVGRTFIESSANRLHDIAGEISERQRSLQRHPNSADANALADLEIQRDIGLLEYQEAQQNAATAELSSKPSEFTQSQLQPGGENKLLYHIGLVTLKKGCPTCNRPMKLQHKTVTSPTFSDFFWQCTGYYDSLNHCKRTESFRPSDLALLHKADIPEIAIDNADLITIASDKSIQAATDRRIAAHLGSNDIDVLCPIHASPMVLREKNGPDDMPLLDKYHLRCTQFSCSQTTKLKSFPQLAAFLRRKEGSGILH